MDAPAPPVPARDPLCDFYWDGAREQRLMIQRCDACGTYIHLPRPICRNCLSFDLSPADVSGRGVLYSFTVTYKAFHPYFVDKVPYVLASVELVEQPGLLVLTNVVGPALAAIALTDVHIGMDLQVAFAPLGPEHMLPVFVPASPAVVPA
jgi:uncharacterized OB-fold protein